MIPHSFPQLPGNYKAMAASTAAGCAGFALAALALSWRHRRARSKHRRLQQRVRVHADDHTVSIAFCVDDDEDAIARLCELAERQRIVGLDCEWRPETKGTTSKTALVQIAAGDLVFVQRILHKDSLHPRLQAVLADESIVKVGLHVRTDAARLLRDTNTLVRNTVDLKDVLSQAGVTDGISLAGISQRLLNVTLDKTYQRSDWATDYLTDGQLLYAAMDAWVTPRLLHRIWSTRSKDGDDESSDILAFAAAYRRDIDPDKTLKKFAKKQRSDAKPAMENGSSADDNEQADNSSENNALSSSSSSSSATTATTRRSFRHAVRKTALYENCRIQAPDGQVLCTCNKKKLAWYVERELADVVEMRDGEPFAVRLRFEPSGRGAYDDDFYLGEKENCCCVCGSKNQYLRHHVVPHSYRQHFPETMKSHLSHDVVLTCLPCHQECNRADQKRMQQLAEEYGVPLGGLNGDKLVLDAAAAKARSSAKTLRQAAQGQTNVPEEQLQYHRDILRSFFELGDDAPIAAELIKQAASLVVKKPSDCWVSHGKAVVERIIERGGYELLEEFIRDWRRHFLAELSPKFMQPFWSVDNRVHNSRGMPPQKNKREHIPL